MSPLQTPRLRMFIALAVISGAAVLAFVFFNFYSGVLAAKRAVMAEDARVQAQLGASTGQSGTRPVVVELFTSEGCSSCPPADALLARLDREQPVHGAQIIILEEHVDYWDSLGWRDRFSSAAVTERQRQYQRYFKLDDIYTPQTVVNGSAQFNGADAGAIEASIRHAAAATAPLEFSSVEVEGYNVHFTLHDLPGLSGHVQIYAALVDPQASTEVRAGENHGRTLHHAGVVRALRALGEPSEVGGDLFSITAPPGSSPDGMRLVVFAQTRPIGPVFAAGSCSIRPENAGSPAERCPVSRTPAQTAFNPTQ